MPLPQTSPFASLPYWQQLDSMSNTTTSILFGRYGIFTKMDSSPKFRHAEPVVLHSGHLSYYVAIACALLVAYLLRSSKQKTVNVPYYKAGMMKWMFDAETLVRDSYSRVS
jgi:hypothetical protein